MKLLLGSLLLAGICQLGAAMNFPTMKSFDNQKIAGNWYPLANIFIDKELPQYTLTTEPKRGLMFSYKYRANHKCESRKFKLIEQGEPGTFKALRPIYFKVLDTDYYTYTISYIARATDSFLMLAGKENSLTTDLEATFSEFANSVGVTGDIVAVDQEESC